ncbi:glycosyltransferase [Allosalinactinospora lopnorensis]|uniref:glycosyltransferase n=1 Tax=Allosalinactinospora lopnorensis TaxID=1352348 RepID=UPI000623EFF3|nr:glycosyltransferase [Allosalinactinospora lopnorensis]
MRILLWHVHGSWTTSLVRRDPARGAHTYLVPVTPDRGPDGRGRARTWDWPDTVVEVPPERLADEPVDVVLLQRPHELELARRWLRREPGRDLPAVYVEHNTPRGSAPETVHTAAGLDGITVVHVTHFNALFWDSGQAPTTVIEHGVVDPGHRYTGELARAGVVVNEPVRRGRVTGTDLLPGFAEAAPLDVFGMGVAELPRRLGVAPERLMPFEDLPQQRMHARLAMCRLYVHPIRWTSLGLSLIEAMMLGLPVVALAATETVEAVPEGAGVVSTNTRTLTDAIAVFRDDPALARQVGKAARNAALARYSVSRFQADWDGLLQEVTR